LPRIGNSSSDDGVNLSEPMTNTNHPDDELLAAYAGADPEATGDPAVSEHVAACDRCATTVAELRSLTIALGEMPDLAPSRPLRLLPPVDERRPSFADRLGGVVRGIFAPALTAGAALVLVGAVGTFAPSLQMAQSGDAGALMEDAALNAEVSAAAGQERSQAAPSASEAEAGDGFTTANESAQSTPVALGAGGASPEPDEAAGDYLEASPASGADRETFSTDDRPIWPMLLFSGVALIVLMVMLRWILAPREG
jgi:anti-sigma factor ChrR (cupin superfamily)